MIIEISNIDLTDKQVAEIRKQIKEKYTPQKVKQLNKNMNKLNPNLQAFIETL